MGATSHDVHVDKMLSEMAIDYKPDGLIVQDIFPIVEVGKQSDLYPVFGRQDRLRRQDTARAPGARANPITRTVGSGSYFAPNYSLRYPTTIEDRVNADPVFAAKLYDEAAEYLLDHLLLDWEIRVADMVTNTSNVGSSSAVNSAWSGGAGNCLGDVNTAKDNLEDANGVKCTDITFGQEAWRSFRRDSTVRNLIFGTNNGGGYPNTAQVAELLDVDRVHVGRAYKDSSQEGQSEDLNTVWGDNVLFYHRPESAARNRPSYGYSFRWTGPMLLNMTVMRHPYDTHTQSEDIEVGYYQDEKITGQSYSFLLTAVNSST